jgi:hypothetical protein
MDKQNGIKVYASINVGEEFGATRGILETKLRFQSGCIHFQDNQIALPLKIAIRHRKEL